MVYDPISRHRAIERLVVKQGAEGQARKYYRFRVDRWYGGIVTADCVGCGLLCRFCWVTDSVLNHPVEAGEFYEPKTVADRLTLLADKRGMAHLRVSGGEPTIGRRHLLQLLCSLEKKGYRFILETNGIMIASEQNYVKDLAAYPSVHVRVSLKGCDEQEFATLTGARSKGFRLQLSALKKLVDAGVSCHPSVMSFHRSERLRELSLKLYEISPELSRSLEIEELILYPHVRRRLKTYGLKPVR